MKKKYPYKQIKPEYLFTYFHAKPLHTCGILMIFPYEKGRDPSRWEEDPLNKDK